MFSIPKDPIGDRDAPVLAEASALDDNLDKILATTHAIITDESLKACQPLLALHQASSDEKLRRSIRAALNAAKLENAQYEKRLTETFARIQAAVNTGFKEASNVDGAIIIKIPIDKKYTGSTYDQPTLHSRREQDDILADLIDQLKHLLSVQGFVCKETLSPVLTIGTTKYGGGDVIYVQCTRVKLPLPKAQVKTSTPEETPYY